MHKYAEKEGMNVSIEFSVNYRKIIEAIAYILNKHNKEAKSIFILKCIYYADKYHLQKYARPITGDIYYKLNHGPCAKNAYDILKDKEDYIPKDILCIARDTFTVFNRNNTGDDNKVYKARRESDTSYFSDSDIECLDESIKFCSAFKDYELSNESHKERAWIDAIFKGKMSYELMLDEDIQNRDEIIEYLQEYSRTLCL